jgi:ABC-type sugar transport system ATPase subunit
MIELHNVALQSGTFAMRDISLRIPAGDYGVLMGRTGSGKTTLLEAISGLRTVKSGTIYLAGRDVTKLGPAERGIGYVPQDLALFPTMTVREHFEFALRVRGEAKSVIAERVGEMSRLLGIEHLLNRKPAGLSGGESQRVALGRALSFHPPVLLLDEPLSALDDETRDEMYALLRHVRSQTKITVLHITHSRNEAKLLAERLFMLEDGVVKPWML